MEKELITLFNVKTSGMFSLADFMNIQKLLQTASDDAFPAIISYKVPRNPFLIYMLSFLITLALITFVTALIATLAGPNEYTLQNEEFVLGLGFMIASATVMIVSIIGRHFVKPTKSRAFKEYSKILLMYQSKKSF